MKRKDILRTLEHMAPKPPRFRRGWLGWHLTRNRPTRELLSLKVLDEVLDELWNTPQERIDERGLPIVRRETDHDSRRRACTYRVLRVYSTEQIANEADACNAHPVLTDSLELARRRLL